MKQFLFSCMRSIVKYIWVVLLFTACENNTSSSNIAESTIRINVFTARNEKAYLVKLPYFNERRSIIDSQVIASASQPILFKVPLEPDRQYQVEISKSHRSFYFIADAQTISITFNNINGKCVVDGSPASISLQNFKESQLKLFDSIEVVDKRSKLSRQDKKLVINRLNAIVNENNYHYADTVSNIAAFIDIFNRIDFSNDHIALDSFTSRAEQRFHGNAFVKLIRRQALEMIDIYAKEFVAGDSLPSIALPDDMGAFFSTGSLQGKYYLINFWASWYPKTYPYLQAGQKVDMNAYAGRLAIVNVALDDDRKNWNNFLIAAGNRAINLIDTGIWHGIAANTLKFDSIPFNFLVNPSGKIIAKAIVPDSLQYVLKEKLR